MTTQDAAKAIGHPLKVRILEMLAKGESSPSKLAVELGEKFGDVAYHIRHLARLGAIRQTRLAKVRGASEHYYRAAVKITITIEPIK